MDCNNSTLKIVRGNDFSVQVKVLRAVKQEDGTTEYVQVELSKCTDITTRLVNRIGRRVELMYTIDGEKLLIDFDGSLPSAVYGLEVVGKYEDGHDWRYYAQPGEFLQIVEPTSAATGLEGDGAVEPTGPLAWNAPVLSETLSAQQVEEMKAATANANAAAEDATIAADKANEAATKANESAENANRMADNATEAATNATTAADKATEAATSADTIATEAKAKAEEAAALVESATATEQEREEAEGKRASAEAARVEAEDKRATAESTRATTESERAKSEADRMTAESARASAENTRVTAEGKRADAESARATAEQGRVTAESSRATAEDKRATAESGRVTAESARATAESSRVSAENARATAEQKRADAEKIRQDNEAQRIANESARKEAETKRATAEAAREEASAKAVSDMDAAVKNAEETVEGAEKVNAIIDNGYIVVTDRTGKEYTADIGDLQETVNVSVTTNVQGVTIPGTVLNVYLNNGSTPQQYTLDEDGKVSFDVQTGAYYQIVFPDKTGCKHIDPIGYTATLRSRDITANYEEYTADESEAVTVTVTKRQDGNSVPWEGATVHVKIGTTTTDYTTDADGNVNFTVELNTQYTVSMDSDVNGWYTHKQDYVKTYTAKAVTRQVWFTWYPYRTGVFVVGTDGVEYTEEEWDASGLDASEAQLIKCVTESLVSGSGVIYIPIDDLAARTYPNKQWSVPSWDIADIPNNQSSANYFNGVVSTDLILASAEEQGGEVPAADYCRSQTITNGGVTMTGYLGSVGQWQQLWLNRDGVDAWLKKIKGEDVNLFSAWTNPKWTSTQNAASRAMFFGSSPGSYYKGDNAAAVPFFAY